MGDEKGPFIISYKGDKDYEIPQWEEGISKHKIQGLVSWEVARLLYAQLKRNEALANQYNLTDELAWRQKTIEQAIKNIWSITELTTSKIATFIDQNWWISVYDEELYQEEVKLIIYWWTQLLLKDMETRLRSPNLLAWILPYQDTPHPNIFNWKKYNEIVPYFVENYEEIKELLLSMKEIIMQILENWNLLTFNNHACWFNLPFLAEIFNEILGIKHENQYIVAWFILLCSEFWFYGPINSANILMTIPDTASTYWMVWVDNIVGKIRKIFLVNTLRLFGSNSKGNVLEIVPSATTDVSVWDKLYLEYPVETTLKLMGTLMNIKQSNRSLSVWIDDRDVMKVLWQFNSWNIPFSLRKFLSLEDDYEKGEKTFFWKYAMENLGETISWFWWYFNVSRSELNPTKT